MNDICQIIDRPMDFSTIKNQMEAKDGTGYKHVREIYSDVRLVFRNAMKYNDEKSDVHRMAKSLLEKFEEKWLQFLPKVTEEVIISEILFVIYGFLSCSLHVYTFSRDLENDHNICILGRKTRTGGS